MGEGVPSLRERTEAKEKVEKLLRHINNVQEACVLLGKRLIDNGEIDFGIKLIAAGQIHDASKWRGIEWKYLVGKANNTNGELKLAIEQHQSSNSHHVEAWLGVENMPRIAVAEMVADWLS